MEILSSPDLGDKVFFNVTGLIRTLAGMGLTVETAVALPQTAGAIMERPILNSAASRVQATMR